MWLCKRDLSKECEGKYRDCTDCVLDKIRAEIEELKNAPPCFDDMFEYKYAVDDVLAIIDKYKSESEE